MKKRNYDFECWVMKNYIEKNQRFIIIKNRLDNTHVEHTSAIFQRYCDMKDGLLKSYMEDKQIKKMYKAHLAIEKMLGNYHE